MKFNISNVKFKINQCKFRILRNIDKIIKVIYGHYIILFLFYLNTK